MPDWIIPVSQALQWIDDIFSLFRAMFIDAPDPLVWLSTFVLTALAIKIVIEVV